LAAIEFIVEALVPSAYLRTPVLGTSPLQRTLLHRSRSIGQAAHHYLLANRPEIPERADYETLFTSSRNRCGGRVLQRVRSGKAALQPNATVVSLLQGSAGKSVELHLRSGDKMGGKIAQVTDNVVHLSNLTGAEYFNALVDVKDISAVVRVAGR
jgi:hypothetical protein